MNFGDKGSVEVPALDCNLSVFRDIPRFLSMVFVSTSFSITFVVEAIVTGWLLIFIVLSQVWRPWILGCRLCFTMMVVNACKASLESCNIFYHFAMQCVAHLLIKHSYFILLLHFHLIGFTSIPLYEHSRLPITFKALTAHAATAPETSLNVQDK